MSMTGGTVTRYLLCAGEGWFQATDDRVVFSQGVRSAIGQASESLLENPGCEKQDEVWVRC